MRIPFLHASRLKGLVAASVLSSLLGCANNLTSTAPTSTTKVAPPVTAITLSPTQTSVRVASTAQFAANLTGGSAQTTGTWSVVGGAANGTITQLGLYTAPATLPSDAVTVQYTAAGISATASATVLNPLPTLISTSPATVSQLTTQLTIVGSGFESSSQAVVDGVPVSTTYVDASHLNVNLAVAGTQTSVTVLVSNPNPGQASSASLSIPVALSQMTVSPATLPTGAITISVTMPGVGNGSIVQVNGNSFITTSVSGNVVTATGSLPPWTQGEVPVQVTASDGSSVLAQASVPIVTTATSFDAAARFSTQAAWGPRPDVVQHIQNVGFSQFIKEQLAAPIGNYDVTVVNPIRSFMINITTGNSLLRLRTAWAFQTFMPGQSFFSDRNKALPWELTLERDSFSNYRQILKDTALDPNIGFLLNNAGNQASTDPNVHPNQNYARELLQLFSIGTVMLNQDGTVRYDAQGHTIPAYDQNTILDMSRTLTGWNWGQPVDVWFTYQPWGMDFSVPLVAVENQHDHGSKTIFGTVQIPAGQTTAQDLDSAIDAIMNHPNTAPFVSRLLIQRLTKSGPSPAYVQRIASVFQDNGQGVSGDLSAVITAILLDPEARSGDVTPDPSDGFLQDPLYQQMFLMSVLQLSGEDDQPTYIFNGFSEQFWNPGTVFAYFSPSYLIPGTDINSPEFQLLTNYTDIQRSQFLWSVVTLQQAGFNNGYVGWLYDNFRTVPSMLDALDHLLYHGTMTADQKRVIQNYSMTFSDPRLQIAAAVFLALNANSYLVSH